MGRGRDNPLRHSVQDKDKVRTVQPGPGFSSRTGGGNGTEAYWIEEVRRKVLDRRRPCSQPSHGIIRIRYITADDITSSSSSRPLTLEDTEVRLDRTVRLEEGIPPDSTCAERPSARSARSGFDIIGTIRRLTCE